MPATLPFRFTSLPRLSKNEVALHQSLAAFIGSTPLRPNFGRSLCDSLAESFKLTCQLSRPEQDLVSTSQLGDRLPAEGCFALLSLGTTPHKVLLDIDTTLAAFAIERLLGGSGEQARMQRPFTDIEFGVLSFVVLRALGVVAQQLETGHELPLCLQTFANRFDALGPLAHDAAAGFVQVGAHLQIGDILGRVRLMLPEAILTERFGNPIPQSFATDRELDYMRRRLMSIGERQTMARMQVARVDLQPKDVANVEVGDIIILEDHHIKVTADGIEGEIFVTLGDGRNGGFTARLRNDESEADQARLEVLKIIVQQQPMEATMAAAEPDDNLPETEGLLRDVDASVAVELGRIKMSTAQVVRLRSGQILRLTRGPNDPVDLVVGGKLFARGELIEVEGELGVRLTQIAGNE